MILNRLSEKTGIAPLRLSLFINSAGYKYVSYPIPKRTGGYRLINHPSKPLKILQRILIKDYLIKFPVHMSAKSYRKGISIVDNVVLHKKNNFFLRVDFRDFFPSIRDIDVQYALMKNAPLTGLTLNNEDLEIISKISCHKNKLTIGAPTSPILSNIVMYQFDERMFQFANESKVTYTRYADDLFFSTNEPNVLSKILVEIRKIIGLGEICPKLIINESKTVFSSKKRKRMLTGLIITSENKISIGRDKKREIKAKVFAYKNGKIAHEDYLNLKGVLSYVKSVEPSFLESLEQKYGASFMAQLYN